MKRYLKLVNFEFNRIANLFFALLALILVVQVTGVMVKSNRYMAKVNHALHEELMTKTQFLAESSPMSMIEVGQSLWFFGPIVLCAAFVIFYIFMIWYRDWFGKNTFIYRLLMLPTDRLNVFLAKLTTILLLTFGFVSFQLMLLPVESAVLSWMIPNDLLIELPVEQIISRTDFTSSFIPNGILSFFLYYGAGVIAVSVVFTAILLERSYRLKGIFIAAGYCALSVLVFAAPLLLQSLVIENYFYDLELLALMIFSGLVVWFGSVWLSRRILNKSIRV
ncbi:MAG TPA: hypothetical protein VFK44_06705 [Bacillales bacterium]|nr:hypothetical protein [Bacillales bacterium]